VLTAAETLAIRHDAVLSPPRPPGAARSAKGNPAMITVTIWHNVAHDGEGRPTAMLDGYRPGDPMVRVFTYQADPAGRPREEIAEEAFDTLQRPSQEPRGGKELARLYYRHRLLRSLSFPGSSRVARGRVAPTEASSDPGSSLT
jgi:hypothetical protein